MLLGRTGLCSVCNKISALPNRLGEVLIQSMKGTDHPFFPPLGQDEKEWLSVTLNSKAVRSAVGDDSKSANAIMGTNAMRVLRLPG